MKNRPKPKVRPVDYHLECCIVARFRKMTSTGRSPLFSQILPITSQFQRFAPTNLALERFWGSTITAGNQDFQLNSWKSFGNHIETFSVAGKQHIYSSY